MRQATAFWVERPGVGALRRQRVDEPGRGEVLVRTLYTGISRGTESVVFRGEVPESEHTRMRAPFQRGDFPAPVEYGYLNVGVVEDGPRALIGRTVFTLYPHQSAFVVPDSAVAVVPADIPARRAVLAGAVRIAVIGAGMIGCAVARIASGLPGADVAIIDVDPDKAAVCERLGVAFCLPDQAPDERDLVIDTSGSEAGLQLALRCAATEGEIIEASWFGDRSVTLDLGGAFHSRRLSIRSSQVGMVSPRRRGTRSFADRMALAVALLRDPAFDALLTGDSSWRDLPGIMAGIADGSTPGLCHTIDWRDAA